MKFRLKERFLLEGKNLQKTFDQYKNKLEDADTGEPFENNDEAYQKFISIIKEDPTYQEGGSTTGDYGIWLLNQEIKGNLNKFRINHHFEFSVTDLLNEFIEKKANLANKDLNSYKSPDELYKILSDVQLTDRQKERKLRKDISGAKHVGSTANFDIYIPETYEASCALGKGSGWCTADSRTRQYYDYYKDKYGGDYYIIISKDGKWKYQIHFESEQYSAAGTNPDINSPNEEEMLELDDITSKWPELKNELLEIKASTDPAIVIRDILKERFSEEIVIQISLQDLEKYIPIPGGILQWFITDVDEIPRVRVMKEIVNNNDLFARWMKIINQRDKDSILSSEEMEDCTYNAFQFRLMKRIQSLKMSVNNNQLSNTELKFSIFGGKGFVYRITLLDLVHDMLEMNGSRYLIDLVKDQNYNEIRSLFDELLPEDDEERIDKNIINFTKNRLDNILHRIPSLVKEYFSNESTLLFFFEDFEDNIMDAVDNKKFELQHTED